MHCAYVTFSFRGTSSFDIKSIVSVDCTPYLFPWAKRLNSIDKLFIHVSLSFPVIKFSIVNIFPEPS